jgi:hypothetical protein
MWENQVHQVAQPGWEISRLQAKDEWCLLGCDFSCRLVMLTGAQNREPSLLGSA